MNHLSFVAAALGIEAHAVAFNGLVDEGGQMVFTSLKGMDKVLHNLQVGPAMIGARHEFGKVVVVASS